MAAGRIWKHRDLLERWNEAENSLILYSKPLFLSNTILLMFLLKASNIILLDFLFNILLFSSLSNMSNTILLMPFI